MASSPHRTHLYSIIIATYPDEPAPTHHNQAQPPPGGDWRLGEIEVDWVDFTREKSVDMSLSQNHSPPPPGAPESSSGGPHRRRVTGQRSHIPGSAGPEGAGAYKLQPGSSRTQGQPSKKHGLSHNYDDLSLQPLLAHFPGPNPLDSSVASGLTQVGRGVVHLFRHAPPSGLIASLDAHPVGESSRSAAAPASTAKGEWAGEGAEGEDGSLIAILAVPAWMRPADFLEFIGGWSTCLEGVRMIREATTPNRSIVLLKFRDPLQASDFLVIFTGRAFSTLDTRETCHPIRIHHLVLHRMDSPSSSSSSSSSPRTPTAPLRPKSPLAIPAFPPTVYASRARTLPDLLTGIPPQGKFELPSCPVCLERLDSTVTGLVTLPCAHTFDCDCLRKWGDSRCPVCRVSHLLLAAGSAGVPATSDPRLGIGGREEILRLTKCATCDSTTNNWICVVCGVVGCGRYDPGKGHARRHWEESGHVLAMELETQRVWDYKGDNYVHRLIQTRTDGKLVELPSASSLVTPLARPLPLSSRHFPRTSSPSPSPRRGLHGADSPQAGTNGVETDRAGDAAKTSHARQNSDNTHSRDRSPPENEAGPSSNDVEKMSTIEAITLEYSYLLSSQLEAMRQHYEKEQSAILARLTELESSTARVSAAEAARLEAESAREKAERKALKATELTRSMQATLAAEKAMSEGMAARIKRMEQQLEERERKGKERDEEVKGLEETVRDLMFSLEAGMRIQEAGGVEAGEGGDLVVMPRQDEAAGPPGRARRKKK